MKLYIGIDWSERKHDIVFLNPAGATLAYLVIEHSVEGFQEFDRLRQKLGAEPEECRVGLETAHTLLIDFLWGQGYTELYVLPPSSVKSSRQRFKVSQAHDDQQDATQIAELLRKESQRFRPWQPGGVLLQALRARVNFLQYLTRQNVRLSNRLRSVLLRYYPAALVVFSGLGAQITLELVLAYPTPQAAAQLTWPEFQTFAQAHHYPQPKHLPTCFAKLQQPRPQATPSVTQAYQMEAATLARLLLHAIQAKTQVLQTLQDLYEQHPDYALFHSLPAAGETLGPALLSKFGEDRRRFPTPNSLQTLAGTCPVTEKSGKTRRVYFRRACDRDFQHIAQQWAKASLRESVWANTYYLEVLKHSRSASHALRCLANRWLAVAWRVWQDRKPYDETFHLQRHALRAKPK